MTARCALVGLEKGRLEFHLRRELERTFALRSALLDEPDRAALGVARLHDADEKLREVFLAAQFLFAELRDLFHEPLNPEPGGVDRLFLGHGRVEVREPGF